MCYINLVFDEADDEWQLFTNCAEKDDVIVALAEWLVNYAIGVDERPTT